MPSQPHFWKIGVWPLALAMLLHGLPWWMMHRGGGSGPDLPERSMQFREIRVQAPAPVRELAQAIMAPTPQVETPAPAAPQVAAPAPVDVAPASEPAAVPDLASPTSVTESAPIESPGNGQPPGWIFDPESYVLAEELDQPPQLVGDWVINEAAVPVEVKDRPRRIKVVVRMWVSAEGHMDIVQYLDADPVVPWLDVLLKDLDKSTLKPAMRDGQPVASSWMVELDIDLVNAY
jgi:hypothetical protein